MRSVWCEQKATKLPLRRGFTWALPGLFRIPGTHRWRTLTFRYSCTFLGHYIYQALGGPLNFSIYKTLKCLLSDSAHQSMLHELPFHRWRNWGPEGIKWCHTARGRMSRILIPLRGTPEICCVFFFPVKDVTSAKGRSRMRWNQRLRGMQGACSLALLSPRAPASAFLELLPKVWTLRIASNSLLISQRDWSLSSPCARSYLQKYGQPFDPHPGREAFRDESASPSGLCLPSARLQGIQALCDLGLSGWRKDKRGQMASLGPQLMLVLKS